MLPNNRIIFALHHFLGEIPRVLAGYIEKACVRRADEFDLYIGWFRHGAFLKAEAEIKTATHRRRIRSRANGENASQCQEKACAAILPKNAALFTSS